MVNIQHINCVNVCLNDLLNQFKQIENAILIKKSPKNPQKLLIKRDKFSIIYKQNGKNYEENLCDITTKELLDKFKAENYKETKTIEELAVSCSTGIIETINPNATLYLLAKLCYRKSLFENIPFYFDDKILDFQDLSSLNFGYSNLIDLPKNPKKIIDLAKENGLTEKELNEFAIFSLDENMNKSIKIGDYSKISLMASIY